MENTIRLIRGQVWRWIDPIYGEKRGGKRHDVEVGEMTLRYNRYVIIMQDTYSIDQHSVLVIPCSSHKRYETDIRIDLTHTFSTTSTYAQPRKMFPAHPKMLDKYICTLSDEVMLDLEMAMSSILTPEVSVFLCNHGDEVLSSKMIEIYEKGYNKPKQPAEDCRGCIHDFINDNIIVNNSELEIPVGDIRDVFDRWCGDKGIDYNDIDMPMFVDYLCRELDIEDFFHTDKYKYHHIKIKGIELKGYHNEDDDNNKAIWDSFRKKDFLRYLESNGIDKTAEAFDIKPSTVSRYKSRFTKELEETDGEIEVKIEDVTTNDEYIGKDEMLRIISSFSNIVTNDIHERGMYRQYKRNFKGNHPMKENTYYRAISSSVYYALLMLFNMKEDSAVIVRMPTIREDHKYISTIKALQEFYNVTVTTNMFNGLEITRYLNKNGRERIALSSDVMPIIRSQLNERLNIKTVAINNLLDKIRSTYCK